MREKHMERDSHPKLSMWGNALRISVLHYAHLKTGETHGCSSCCKKESVDCPARKKIFPLNIPDHLEEGTERMQTPEDGKRIKAPSLGHDTAVVILNLKQRLLPVEALHDGTANRHGWGRFTGLCLLMLNQQATDKCQKNQSHHLLLSTHWWVQTTLVKLTGSPTKQKDKCVGKGLVGSRGGRQAGGR